MSSSSGSRQSKEARRFLRAAQERLKEAAFLLDHDFTTGAVYLAGYGVECALKALVLFSEPARRNQTTLDSFRGTKAHDFEWLKQELGRRKVDPEPVVEQFGRVRWWSTALRYDPATVDRKLATDFQLAALRIMDWVKGRM